MVFITQFIIIAIIDSISALFTVKAWSSVARGFFSIDGLVHVTYLGVVLYLSSSDVQWSVQTTHLLIFNLVALVIAIPATLRLQITICSRVVADRHPLLQELEQLPSRWRILSVAIFPIVLTVAAWIFSVFFIRGDYGKWLPILVFGFFMARSFFKQYLSLYFSPEQLLVLLDKNQPQGSPFVKPKKFHLLLLSFFLILSWSAIAWQFELLNNVKTVYLLLLLEFQWIIVGILAANFYQGILFAVDEE